MMGATLKAGHPVGTRATLPVCSGFYGAPAPVVCFCVGNNSDAGAGWNCPI